MGVITRKRDNRDFGVFGPFWGCVGRAGCLRARNGDRRARQGAIATRCGNLGFNEKSRGLVPRLFTLTPGGRIVRVPGFSCGSPRSSSGKTSEQMVEPARDNRNVMVGCGEGDVPRSRYRRCGCSAAVNHGPTPPGRQNAGANNSLPFETGFRVFPVQRHGVEVWLHYWVEAARLHTGSFSLLGQSGSATAFPNHSPAGAVDGRTAVRRSRFSLEGTSHSEYRSMASPPLSTKIRITDPKLPNQEILELAERCYRQPHSFPGTLRNPRNRQARSQTRSPDSGSSERTPRCAR